MKKSAIIGMVLATTMSFSAFAAGNAKLMERVAESKAKIEESLYGKDAKGKAVSFASLPKEVQRQKQDALISKLTADKATELRDFIRQDAKMESSRTEMLVNLLAAKTYAESLGEGNAEATGVAKAANAVVKLLANSTRAMDRNDQSTLTLVKQAENILQWSATQRENVSKIIELQDNFMMTEGLDTGAAMVKAIMKVKNVNEVEAKKLAEKIKELC